MPRLLELFKCISSFQLIVSNNHMLVQKLLLVIFMSCLGTVKILCLLLLRNNVKLSIVIKSS